MNGLAKCTQHFNATYHIVGHMLHTWPPCCNMLDSAHSTLKCKIKLVRTLQAQSCTNMPKRVKHHATSKRRLKIWTICNLKTICNMSQHIATGWLNVTVQHVVPNVVMCCIKLLRSFSQGLDVIHYMTKSGQQNSSKFKIQFLPFKITTCKIIHILVTFIICFTSKKKRSQACNLLVLGTADLVMIS